MSSSANQFRYFLLLAMLCCYLPTMTEARLVTKVSLTAGLVEDETVTGETHSIDSQSLRFLWDKADQNNVSTAHLLLTRFNLSGSPQSNSPQADPFRPKSLSFDLLEVIPDGAGDRVELSFDHLYYQASLKNTRITFGRQPIDWGSGRIWQAHNVFGSFSPLTLDTEYKPGVDGILFEYFPGSYSTLSTAVLLNNNQFSDRWASFASRYTTLVGDESEFSVLAGNVLGASVFGFGLESSMYGLGLRAELAFSKQVGDHHKSLIVTGVDYQYANGITSALEWRFQEGTNTIETSPERHRIGLLLSKEIMPLFTGGYLILYTPHGNEGMQDSFLQQLHVSYSVSDESLLLLSLSHSRNGISVDEALAQSFMLNYRVYF